MINEVIIMLSDTLQSVLRQMWNRCIILCIGLQVFKYRHSLPVSKTGDTKQHSQVLGRTLRFAGMET